MGDPRTTAMATIGGAVAIATALAPRRFLGLFGLSDEEVTGAAILGWRLMAVRTASISLLAASGDAVARDLFMPVQVMDQAAWWWGYRRGQLPLRTAVLAATASGAIIALDLARRASEA